MARCPKCSGMGYIVGQGCLACGHGPDEPLVKPSPPEGDPVGPAREFCCRYCQTVCLSAEDCRAHQARAHIGVGEVLVTDLTAE